MIYFRKRKYRILFGITVPIKIFAIEYAFALNMGGVMEISPMVGWVCFECFRLSGSVGIQHDRKYATYASREIQRVSWYLLCSRDEEWWGYIRTLCFKLY